MLKDAQGFSRSVQGVSKECLKGCLNVEKGVCKVFVFKLCVERVEGCFTKCFEIVDTLSKGCDKVVKRSL